MVAAGRSRAARCASTSGFTNEWLNSWMMVGTVLARTNSGAPAESVRKTLRIAYSSRDPSAAW
jgi:hypothetical protein